MQASVVTLRVSLPVSLLSGLLMEYLPRPLLQGTRRHRFHTMSPTKRSKNESPFELPFAFMRDAARELTAIDGNIDYSVEIAGLEMQVEEDLLTIKATVDFSLRSRVDAGLAALEVLRWGVRGPRPRVLLTLQTRVAWGQGGNIEFTQKEWSLKWLLARPPEGMGINPEELLNLPQIHQMFEGFLDNLIVNGTPGEYSVYRLLEGKVQRLYRPFRISENLWLKLNPEALTVYGMVGEGNRILSLLGIHCKPEVIFGAKPEPTTWVKPTVTSEHLGESFRARTLARFSYAELEVSLRKILSQSRDILWRYRLVVKSVHITGDLNGIRMRLYTVSPLRALLYLEGQPQYEFYRKRVVFKDLDFRIVSGKQWVRVFDGVVHEAVRRYLSRKIVFELDEYLERIKAELVDFKLQDQVTDEIELGLQGSASTLEIQNVYFDSFGLNAVATISGQASIDLD
jgi:hypothetical protein